MCGIVGVISEEPIRVREGLEMLKRLEYRGYDSAGFATTEGHIVKKAGQIDEIINTLDEEYLEHKSRAMIFHTRWATHGEVNDINAHPHTDCTENIYVVHNGTITNFEELKEELVEKGHEFYSDTDTEVIAHFIEDRLNEGKTMKEIANEIFHRFRGTYAILVLIRNQHKLYAIKNGSPLVVGIDEKNHRVYIASDVYAFIDKTNKIIVLDDYEYLEVSVDSSIETLVSIEEPSKLSN